MNSSSQRTSDNTRHRSSSAAWTNRVLLSTTILFSSQFVVTSAARDNGLDEFMSPAQSVNVDGAAPGATTSHTHWNHFLHKEREPRQNREPVFVDYQGQHPFEQRKRHLHNYNTSQQSNQRQTQQSYEYEDASYYQPIRVQFDTHLLDALADAYPSHVSYVRHVLLPSLRNFWADTLSVIPATEIEVPLSGDNALCAQEVTKVCGYNLGDFLVYDDNNYASDIAARSVTNIGNDGNVEMNLENNSLVYKDVDLVVIVIPVEGTSLCDDSTTFDPENSSQLQTLAFATNCQHDQLDRPTVGYTGICFGPIDPNDRSVKTHTSRVTTVAHEFTHILGMNSYDFPFFWSHVTGAPRTRRDEYNRPPEAEVLCVDGTRQYVMVASEDVVKASTTANGYIAYEIVTETVRNVARNQFDCSTMSGARLENQPTASQDIDCFGSHWDHRLFNNEYMTAVYTGSTQYVTALTLALLEDSGWYLPNYAVAENNPFALGAGCDFVDTPCIQDGKVPSWGEGIFCNSASSIGCTPDKELVAVCDISKWDANLPSGYQYFEESDIGGGLQQMDFCPSFTTMFKFDNSQILDCTNPDLNGVWLESADEVFGVSSKCIQQAGGVRPLCLETVCGEYGDEAGKVVLVAEDGKRIRCSYTGEVLKLPSGSKVICPSFEQTCPNSICPGNCAGRGACDFSLSPPQCECFDRSDSSQFCSSSPLSFAPTISPAPTVSASPSAAPTISSSPTADTSSGAGPSSYLAWKFLTLFLITRLW